MSESTRDDEAQPPEDAEVEDFGQFHADLEARLEELQTATDNADGDYEMTVEETDGSYFAVSVSIESDDWILNEGEIGDMNFHAILRECGGLSVLNSRRDLVDGTKDYLDRCDTKNDAWDRFVTDIKRAK